jgi:DNA polymerase-1
MDMYISEQEARHILKTYEQTFPGVRNRKNNIQKILRQYRKLSTPLGRERYFYGRMDDSTFREAYAYAPQSTIPDITNHLMLKLWEYRDVFECEFLLQVHDSLLLQVPRGRESEIAEFARDLSIWHPRIMLPGGQLLIPVEVEVGERWNPMQKI